MELKKTIRTFLALMNAIIFPSNLKYVLMAFERMFVKILVHCILKK